MTQCKSCESDLRESFCTCDFCVTQENNTNEVNKND